MLPPAEPQPEAPEERRRIVCAVELGWRIAYLYADLKHPLHDAPAASTVLPCLPAYESLPAGDQLELQVRAVASLARRLHLYADADRIDDMAEAAQGAVETDEREVLRTQVRVRHRALIKELWAVREGEGKAYELGSSLFDTWDRLRMASAQGRERMLEEWAGVFHEVRVERIKLLLDDLQTRLDPAAVTVVKEHLDRWRERVDCALQTDREGLPCGEGAVAQVRSQALIWRQLVTRDKEPEAYLQRNHRAAVRHEFNRLIWRSLLRPVPVACALACLAIVVAMVVGGDKATAVQKALLPLLAAIGLTQASLLVVARERLRVWTELLWNRAVAKVVFDVTCRADLLFPARRRGARLRAAGQVRRSRGRALGDYAAARSPASSSSTSY